jgi:hypothetical protein
LVHSGIHRALGGASRLSTTWTLLVDRYDSGDEWRQAQTAHVQALRQFEAAVRRLMGDTTPLPN